MSTKRSSLEETLKKAGATREREMSLSELTGRSEREIAQMTDKELTKLAETGLDKLRETAIEKQEITTFTFRDEAGKAHKVQIVPMALDSPEANAIKDGDSETNSILDKLRVAFETLKKVLKAAEYPVIPYERTAVRQVNEGLHAAEREFGR